MLAIEYGGTTIMWEWSVTDQYNYNLSACDAVCSKDLLSDRKICVNPATAGDMLIHLLSKNSKP